VQEELLLKKSRQKGNTKVGLRRLGGVCKRETEKKNEKPKERMEIRRKIVRWGREQNDLENPVRRPRREDRSLKKGRSPEE